MIYPAVRFITELLNQFMLNRFQLNDEIVCMSNLSSSEGVGTANIENKVVLTIINIEEETLKPFNVNYKQLSSGEFAKINTTKKYKLFVMFSCNQKVYSEALKFVDAILLFFQQTPYISIETNSNLPDSIQKLDFEIEKINYTAMQNLWNAMGVKYRPSLVYVIRLIGVQSGIEQEFINPVYKGMATISNG